MNFPLPKSVDRSRVFKYLNITTPNENVLNLIKKAEKTVLETVLGLVCHKVFNNIDEDILVGEDIKKHLYGCCGFVIFAVTLSPAVDRLIKKYTVTDKAFAVVIDAVSSVVCEQLEEDFTQSLKQEFNSKNLFLTKSYAPGYGDYPLSIVDKYIQKIDANKQIGITVNSDHFMIPTKSITAIMGISKTPTDGFLAGCEHCKLYADCKIRKGGKTCVR